MSCSDDHSMNLWTITKTTFENLLHISEVTEDLYFINTVISFTNNRVAICSREKKYVITSNPFDEVKRDSCIWKWKR